jgi:hypothetical protein
LRKWDGEIPTTGKTIAGAMGVRARKPLSIKRQGLRFNGGTTHAKGLLEVDLKCICARFFNSTNLTT